MPALTTMMDWLAARRRKPGGRAATSNQSSSATVASISAALRNAEKGDTRLWFALVRDMLLGGSHVAGEFNTRKLAAVNEPMQILPADPKRPEDVRAAEACRIMVGECPVWTDALSLALDSIVWPVSVLERVYTPATGAWGLRYLLKDLRHVGMEELCFRHNTAGGKWDSLPQDPQAPEEWERGIRLYNSTPDGRIDYNLDATIPLDPRRFLVHRGYPASAHLSRDWWGGPARALVFWWFFASSGRDWFSRALERFGTPFLVGRTDTGDKANVDLMEEAFTAATRIHGLIVNHDDAVELHEAASSDAAAAHEQFIELCNAHVSRFLLGQTLSSKSAATGLGSGVAKLHGQVREDFRDWDRFRLGQTVRAQIFRPFLAVNGIPGAPPVARWGVFGLGDAVATAQLVGTLKAGGLEPTDESLLAVQARVGFPLRRIVTAPRSDFTDPPASSHGIDLLALRAEVKAIAVTSTSREDLKARLASYAKCRAWNRERMAEGIELALRIFAAESQSNMPPIRMVRLVRPKSALPGTLSNPGTALKCPRTVSPS